MTRLQDDIIGVYNTLTDFSESTLISGLPIHVYYEDQLNSLCFEQAGRKVAIQALNYYCNDLRFVDTYLLPRDYDILMSTLATLIGSGIMIKDRLLLEPVKYGFNIYETDGKALKNGPKLLSRVRVIKKNGILYRWFVKLIYKNQL